MSAAEIATMYGGASPVGCLRRCMRPIHGSRIGHLAGRQPRAATHPYPVSGLAAGAPAAACSNGLAERGQIPARRWRNRVVVDERAATDFLAIRPLRTAEETGADHG